MSWTGLLGNSICAPDQGHCQVPRRDYSVGRDHWMRAYNITMVLRPRSVTQNRYRVKHLVVDPLKRLSYNCCENSETIRDERLEIFPQVTETLAHLCTKACPFVYQGLPICVPSFSFVTCGIVNL